MYSVVAGPCLGGNSNRASPRSSFDRVRGAQALEEGTASASRYRSASQAASLTSIFFGADLAGFGIVSFKTPVAILAWTLDGARPGGNCNTRRNTPQLRSLG